MDISSKNINNNGSKRKVKKKKIGTRKGRKINERQEQEDGRRIYGTTKVKANNAASASKQQDLEVNLSTTKQPLGNHE